MSTETITGKFPEFKTASRQFSGLEKYVLMRAHPRKIFFDMIAVLWATYFLWNNRWQAAIFIGLVFSSIGLVSVIGTIPERMAETTLGKIALLHLHPTNLAIQIIGTPILIYGLWVHSAELILLGVSVLFLGHITGWEKVHPNFAFELRDQFYDGQEGPQ